jgi:hypothetical protein
MGKNDSNKKKQWNMGNKCFFKKQLGLKNEKYPHFLWSTTTIWGRKETKYEILTYKIINFLMF